MRGDTKVHENSVDLHNTLRCEKLFDPAEVTVKKSRPVAEGRKPAPGCREGFLVGVDAQKRAGEVLEEKRGVPSRKCRTSSGMTGV
jgi:hypothetical protein